MSQLDDAIQFILAFKSENPGADKGAVQQAYVNHFQPVRRRSLFIGPGYAIRFSKAGATSFANTVLSLSALRAVDDQPVVIAVVGPDAVRFLLANSTFLRKASHTSSRDLRVDNVRGSFNGPDILTEYESIPNRPESFEQLFAIHSAFTWAENLERLVEATNAIVGRDVRFRPTDTQRETVLEAPARASRALASADFEELESSLCASVQERREEVLAAAAVDNVNLRGNRIEQIVTGSPPTHELGDLRRVLSTGTIAIDIKTKLAGRASAPKAYNIDKMLAFHAEPGSVLAFLMLGIDSHSGSIVVRLVPVLDAVLLEATVIQHHWSGRSSRGVTQLTGRYDRVLEPGFTAAVDVERAEQFLSDLLAR